MRHQPAERGQARASCRRCLASRRSTTSTRDCPVRKRQAGSTRAMQVQDKEDCPPTIIAPRNSANGPSRLTVQAALVAPGPRRRQEGPDPRGLPSVPYQGIRPRSSRTSVVPIAATQAADRRAAQGTSPRRLARSQRPVGCPRQLHRQGRRRPASTAVQNADAQDDLQSRAGTSAMPFKRRSRCRDRQETQESQPRAPTHSESRLRRCRA